MTIRSKHLAFLLITMMAVVLMGCTGRGRHHTANEQQPANTQYTEARAIALYEKNPEQALSMIESAEMAGTMPDFRASMLRAKLFSASVYDQRQDAALQICETLLRHDSVKANTTYQQEVLELLVNASRMRHDDEQWMRWALRLCDLYRQQGYEADALRTEAEIGLVLTHLGQETEGMAKIDGAISRLDGQRHFDALNAFVLAMKRKIVVLRETNRHADILPVANHLLECLADYEAHPDAYSDGSRHEPKTTEDRADYCDFYGAQATAFKAAAYAETSDYVNARRELAAFRHTNYGHSLDGRKMIAPTLGLLGDYDDMLAIYDDAEAELRGDTLRNDYADILLARASAAEAQGRLGLSLAFRKRYEALSQQLWQRLQRSEAHQYAARYHAQEQQMEIDLRKADAERNGIIAMALAIVLMAAIAFAIYFFWQKRFMAHKNRVLVEQISDAIEYRNKFMELTRQLHLKPATTVRERGDGAPTEEPTATPPPTAQLPGSNEAATAGATLSGEGAEHGTDDVPIANLNAMSDEELFQYISEGILREKLYLNPVCDRQTITDRFGLSEKRVGAAFSKGSTYKSLASFVRDSRLEYACQLLRQRPEMSIGSVASASGFSNHTRFATDFKTRYSVSPTEFRTLSM